MAGRSPEAGELAAAQAPPHDGIGETRRYPFRLWKSTEQAERCPAPRVSEEEFRRKAAPLALPESPRRQGRRPSLLKYKMNRKTGRGISPSDRLFFFVFPFYAGQRIGFGRHPQGVIVHVGVDLRGIQVVMAQDLLDRPHVHAVLQHQRGGGVAQLVG